MKKVIFSAIMMMAFVGTSFGKTGEVEVVSKQNLLIEQTIEKPAVVEAPNWSITFTPCEIIYIKTLKLASDLGFNDEDAGAIAYGAFNACD